MIDLLRRFFRTTFGHALAGAVVLWAALPPCDLGPLAFVAPVAWILLIRRESLPGRRPYRALYAVGFLFWMAALHWLRLPHPATSLGWVAMSAYFACYLPLFVCLSRTAVHQWRVPVILAAPIVWTGLELVRAYLFTGMTMASLGHTQYRWIALIQISDLAGAYGVGFLVMLVAACLGRMLPIDGRARTWWPLLPAGAAMAAALVYGYVRTSGETSEPVLRVALIQGSIDTVLEPEPDIYQRVWKEYLDLSRQAKKKYGELDLLVWPETTFPDTLVTYTTDAQIPDGFEGTDGSEDIDAEFQQYLAQAAAHTPDVMASMAQSLDTALILGVATHHFGPEGVRRFNSAVFVDRGGRLQDRYDKTHLVLFGEYVPFADLFPLAPGADAAAGESRSSGQPARWPSRSAAIATRAEHLLRERPVARDPARQVNTPRGRGSAGSRICWSIVTNDGWFWGSSELDMHLIVRGVSGRSNAANRC